MKPQDLESLGEAQRERIAEQIVPGCWWLRSGCVAVVFDIYPLEEHGMRVSAALSYGGALYTYHESLRGFAECVTLVAPTLTELQRRMREGQHP